MTRKTGMALVAIILCASILTACGTGSTPGAATSKTTIATNAATGTTAAADSVSNTDIEQTGSVDLSSVEFNETDLDSRWSAAASSSITFAGTSIQVGGTGTSVLASQVTITSPGTYVVSGTLDDGQILVDTESDEAVRLVLNGTSITSSTSAPIYVKNAKNVVLILADGTRNSLTDSAGLVYSDTEKMEPDATLFSKSDLTINGTGSLTVTARFNDGITSKDDLRIVSGTVAVTAAGDGIKGKDLVAVKDGTITIDAAGDGMKSTNAEDPSKGFIAIEAGTFKIDAGKDGIQAETMVWIGGGMIRIDAADDAVHSNDRIVIDAGTVTLSSGDDGIHADLGIEINGGDIVIAASYEGIESEAIALNGGNVSVTASDDGINGSSASAVTTVAGRPGMESGGASLLISGGYWYVNANGDGIDINGTIEMTGGTVVVNGPTDNGNGPMDYTGVFKISGGILIAAGSSGMAVAPTDDSTQSSILVNFTSSQAAGTLFRLQNAAGEDIATFAPAKTFQSVLVSDPDLKQGETYRILSGGTVSGTEKNGLYADPAYTAGTTMTELTLSGIVTTYGSGGMGGPGGGMPGGIPGGRR